MAISRQLRIALLISFIWHLFWLSFIRIVYLPGNYSPNQYSSVYFLGSILQSPISVAQTTLPLKTVLANVPSELEIQLDLNHFSQREKQAFVPARGTPDPNSFIDIDKPIKNLPALTSLVSTEPNLLQRKILYQPPLFKYPEWTQQELKAKFTLFRIYISADGLVEQLICTQASGNPEIDAALARHIERWRFAPTFGVQGQWQSVKIDLDF